MNSYKVSYIGEKNNYINEYWRGLWYVSCIVVVDVLGFDVEFITNIVTLIKYIVKKFIKKVTKSEKYICIECYEYRWYSITIR